MKIDDDVLAVLADMKCDGNKAVIATQLDRKAYAKVNLVLEACGGIWNRKAKAHVFVGEARDHIETVLNAGEITTAAEMGFFATPDPLAKRLVELAGLKGGEVVLEPSAGEGAIVDWLQAAGANVVAVEMDGGRQAKLTVRRQMIHDWTCAVRVIDAIDFMDFTWLDPFDAVVMNPPFGKVGKGDHIDHLYHAFNLLKPGGVLVAVMPASVEFRTNARYVQLRAFVRKFGTMERLPDDSFKASGTSVRTCVLRLTRPT